MENSSAVYEMHIMPDKEIPFIFHCDNYDASSGRSSQNNWHENIEILYFAGGSGEVTCSNKTYKTSPGDIIVINSYAAHRICSDEGVTLFCLIVDRKFCRTNSIDTSKLNFKEFICDKAAEAKFQSIICEFAEKRKFSKAGIKSAVLDFMVFLCRNYSEEIPSGTQSASSITESIRFATGYIKANYSKRLTVDMIASEVGLSKYYFLREFKSLTGYTVVTYINTVRCEYAKELLADGKLTVREAAAKCGFENYSYFTKVFKSCTGLMPSQLLHGRGLE